MRIERFNFVLYRTMELSRMELILRPVMLKQAIDTNKFNQIISFSFNGDRVGIRGHILGIIDRATNYQASTSPPWDNVPD